MDAVEGLLFRQSYLSVQLARLREILATANPEQRAMCEHFKNYCKSELDQIAKDLKGLN